VVDPTPTKSYREVMNHVLLLAAHYYYAGASPKYAAYEFYTAVDFIYGVKPKDFLDEFQKRWFGLVERVEEDALSANELHELIEEMDVE